MANSGLPNANSKRIVRWINDPEFPDLSPNKTVVKDGKFDYDNNNSDYKEWKCGDKRRERVKFEDFRSILQFASKKYHKALCTTVIPRILELGSNPERGTSSANGVVTVLHRYHLQSLRDFLDLIGFETFIYVWCPADPKNHSSTQLPFVIRRDEQCVKFGYKKGFKNEDIDPEWKEMHEFKILSNGEWKLEYRSRSGILVQGDNFWGLAHKAMTDQCWHDNNGEYNIGVTCWRKKAQK